MKSYCITDLYFLFVTLVLTSAENEICVITNSVLHQRKASYQGIVLKQVTSIGIQMCLKDCEETGGCTHINYNRFHLTCDLMSGDVYREPDEFIPSTEMTFAALEVEVKYLRHWQL